MAIGKKFIVKFHLNSSDVAVLDDLDFSQTFSYVTLGAPFVVVNKYKVNPTATNPADADNSNGTEVVVTTSYPTGGEPDLATVTVNTLFATAKTAAGY